MSAPITNSLFWDMSVCLSVPAGSSNKNSKTATSKYEAFSAAFDVYVSKAREPELVAQVKKRKWKLFGGIKAGLTSC